MTRGRKGKPGELAERQGNPGHREIVKTPDVVGQIPTDAPPTLTNARARDLWATLIPQLRSLSFVKSTDLNLVARYCMHLARFLALNEKIEGASGEVSYTTETTHGTMQRLHPNFAAMMRIEAALVAIEDRIGLSPASRQSLMVRAAAGFGSPIPGAGLVDPRHGTASPSESPVGLFARVHTDDPVTKPN